MRSEFVAQCMRICPPSQGVKDLGFTGCLLTSIHSPYNQWRGEPPSGKHLLRHIAFHPADGLSFASE